MRPAWWLELREAPVEGLDDPQWFTFTVRVHPLYRAWQFIKTLGW